MPRLAWLSLLLVAATAHAERCPLGEAWDEGMAMCMPAQVSNAELYNLMSSPDGCGPAEYFDFGMSMCLERPRARGRLSGMVMGNVFVAAVGTSGPRGRATLSAPNWAMLDAGVDLARWNRLELDAMLTAELWTTPRRGYPLLFQIGESDASGRPFLDAQHPHSSPVMGLALSDVIALGRFALLRVWFAPRGETTDGPIAFMHRPSGTVNPDAPLGHHIGQDVGHVSSTVIGAALHLRTTTIEASTFHGHEPSPTQVDLPIGAPDSVAVRLSQQIGPQVLAAASLAYVTDPEGEPSIPHLFRVSASLYTQHTLPARWRLHTAFIWGGISDYDHAGFLSSLLVEAVAFDPANALWTRLEVLQRTGGELEIAELPPNLTFWVASLTIGYTRKIVSWGPVDFSVGASGSAGYVPLELETAYGGSTAWSGKLFVEARLMKMFSYMRP